MTLSERIAVANRCAYRACPEQRAPDALFGRTCGHLTDWWMGRLAKTPVGDYLWADVPRRRAA